MGTPTAPPPGSGDAPVVLDRVRGRTGGDLVLRRVGSHYEIFSNGVFLMDTRDGRSERRMVRACLDALPDGGRPLWVLVGGLGVGFSAREALDDPRVGAVRVVELEPRVIDWHRGELGALTGTLPDDPRCAVVNADLVEWLESAAAPPSPDRYDVICLDTDNGPDWTVVEGNERLYGPAALDRLERILAPGGLLSFWSAMRAPAFAELLRQRFGTVEAIEIPVPRGEPDLVYLVRGRG